MSHDHGTNSLKSNAFIAVAAFLLVVTYLLVMRIQLDELGDMTRCIPSTALVYFEQQNGFELFTNLSISPLGQKIQSIDFAAVGKEVGIQYISTTY